jgi:hypothetical protein
MVIHSHRSRARAAAAARPRRGIALVLSIVAIVVIGALIGGAFFSSSQEYRIGRNSIVEQRAFAAAEMGVNNALLRYGPGSNALIPVTLGNPGDTNQFTTVTPMGDSAKVTVTRLTNNAIWIASAGSAGQALGGTRSVRHSNLLMNVTRPDINIAGAITTAGGVRVQGAAKIDGTDIAPAGWGSCDVAAERDTAGIAVAPGQSVTVPQSGNAVTGNPPLSYDAHAADTSTYSHYGSLTWDVLKANANIVVSSDPNPLPVGTATTCDVSGANHIKNWGEPFRVASNLVPGCQNYFPIIYATGDLHMNSNARGQGILLVEGSLIVNGTFDFVGVIIARNDIKAAKGDMKVTGAMLSRNIDLTDNTSAAGSSFIQYSSCAVNAVTNGVAVVTPVRDRSWAQMY